MKCRLVREMESSQGLGVLPAGHVIDHPEAYMLVQLGCAEPADEECEQRVKMTPEQLKAAQHAQERASKGIHPDDFAAYDSGQMLGYNPDGSHIPGPNFVPPSDTEAVDLWLPGDG